MSKIPSDITTPDDARHWLRVNGFSAEKTEALVKEWAENPTSDPVTIEETETEEDEVVEEAPTSIWKSKKK
jgi:hypothetical protein